MTCSIGNTPELINNIIRYLQNDFSTLHSCILVNRLWCRSAIPLLWEDPFSIPTKNHHFLDIYLDKTKYGLFNYPGFIKRLNTIEVSRFIKRWSEAAKRPYSLMSLFEIFVENGASLHAFEVIIDNTFDYYDRWCVDGAIELICQNSKFIHNIKILELTLNRINDDNKFISVFINLLFSKCNSISTLYLNIDDINKYSQIIYQNRNIKDIIFESNCSNTLRTIVFNYINFGNISVLNEAFEQLNALDSIHILYCYSINSHFIDQIIGLTKPFKLKSLFTNERIQINLLQLLLQKSDGYLENIGFHNQDEQPFKLISEHCTKIKLFDILGFDCQYINLIKNIGQNLNYLSIDLLHLFSRSRSDNLSSIVLRKLGTILPFNLEYLCLYLSIETNNFEIFLKNLKNTFISKLLIRSQTRLNDKDISNIKKYIIKRKRVNNLAINDIGGLNLSSFKDEVKDFESYNVKIHNFNYLETKIYDVIKAKYYV